MSLLLSVSVCLSLHTYIYIVCIQTESISIYIYTLSSKGSIELTQLLVPQVPKNRQLSYKFSFHAAAQMTVNLQQTMQIISGSVSIL